MKHTKFEVDPKLARRLYDSSSLGFEDIKRFLELITTQRREDKVFDWFTGWSNDWERKAMYSRIDSNITKALEKGKL